MGVFHFYDVENMQHFEPTKKLGGGFKHFFFYFSSLLWGRFPFWRYNIFQMGGGNHQAENRWTLDSWSSQALEALDSQGSLLWGASDWHLHIHREVPSVGKKLQKVTWSLGAPIKTCFFSRKTVPGKWYMPSKRRRLFEVDDLKGMLRCIQCFVAPQAIQEDRI